MPRLLFITGKLAEPALRRVLAELAPRAGFEYSVAVAPITVVALATTSWLARHVQPPPDVERVILPGLCLGDLADCTKTWANVAVERGPKDLRDLPDFFGKAGTTMNYGAYDIQILAEINHARRLPRPELLAQAAQLWKDGADLIDLGCDPGDPWPEVGDAVKALRDAGMDVSLDTFNTWEAEQGTKAGAQLVLSVNQTNRAAAADWGCEVVAVPDQPAQLEGLDATVDFLIRAGVPFRIDPVLEPIGFGFAASLGRYLEARRRYPDADMLMGVGNLTELTDVDSAGVNVLLAGFCQELGIKSVLTTEVINWCRSCVRELDLARRLVAHAVTNHILPKRLEPKLVLLRDPKLREHGQQALDDLARQINDPNVRLFAERGELHAMARGIYVRGTDPFKLFAELLEHGAIDPSHAFYLGYELAKAMTALTLNKNYTQDQALEWGLLTRPEKGRHEEE